MSRLFFALWPDARVRAEIQAKVSAFPLAGGRLVTDKNTHITLAFLGNVDEKMSTTLIRDAGHLHVAAFSLILDRVGWWNKAKIACLTPSNSPEQLLQLATVLRLMCQSRGLSLDERPYRPHLTFARKVSPSLINISLQPISWNINEFCLLESTSHQSGVKYQVKRSWPLKIM